MPLHTYGGQLSTEALTYEDTISLEAISLVTQSIIDLETTCPLVSI